MTEEELLFALAAESARNDAGRTPSEIAGDTGLPHKKVMEVLQLARGRGRLKVGQRTIQRIDGRPARIGVYTVLP